MRRYSHAIYLISAGYLSMGSIDKSIKQAGLDAEFHIWDGQCLSIAKAIQETFGGDIIFVTELPGEGFDHALVEINGKLYDGSGRVSWGETVTRFIPPESRQEETDDNFYYPDTPIDSFPQAFNKTVYTSVCELLKEATD